MDPFTFALAAGSQVSPVENTPHVLVRETLVVNAANESVSQTSIQGRMSLGSEWSLDAAVPLVVAWDGPWTEVGPGVLVLGARRWVAFNDAISNPDKGAIAFGVEVGVAPLGSGVRPTAWGTLARDTTAMFTVMGIAELSTHSNPRWLFRLALGAQSDAVVADESWIYADGAYLFGIQRPEWFVFYAGEFDLDCIVSISEHTKIVVENQIALDATPLTLRVLGRWAPSDVSLFDLGLQVPVLEYIGVPASLQIVAQAGRSF